MLCDVCSGTFTFGMHSYFVSFSTIIIYFLFDFMNLFKRIGIFGVKHCNSGPLFNYFQICSKIVYQKNNQIKISARFVQLSISSWMENGHKPSRTKNLSARAIARASSAQTHHYYLPKLGLERGTKFLLKYFMYLKMKVS